MPKIIENPAEAILYHARNIVIKEGYASLTMRKVSKISGIAVGTIYNYFPTKEHLALKLIEDYWYDYFKVVDEIDREETDFYTKLFHIFKKLNDFTHTFMEVWIRDSGKGYTDDSRNRKISYMKRLNNRLEEILMNAQCKGIINLSLEPSVIAEFLLLNFIMMSQMQHFEYNNFEKIVKKLFE